VHFRESQKPTEKKTLLKSQVAELKKIKISKLQALTANCAFKPFISINHETTKETRAFYFTKVECLKNLKPP